MGRRSKYQTSIYPLAHAVPEPRSPKPLEYQLVDLLGEPEIGEAEVEALRIVLMFVAGRRKAEAAKAEESEIAALAHDLQRSMSRENHYLNALMDILNTPDCAAAGEIATNALYGGGNLERLRAAAESADRGEGVSLKGLPQDERRALLASADTHPEGQDPAEGLGS